MKYDIRRLFAKSDLVPAVVQDAASKDVLMLAYMNEESLRKTLETGYTWFYSRSRGQLWQKGETSGNVQRVVAVVPDCDDDTLLVTVEQTGVACHTGNWSCFFAEPITGNNDGGNGNNNGQ
jgi:phosphoribosyl-AMP cyclohydrolase